MKGVVFIEFCNMVSNAFSEEVLDEIIERSDLPSGGAYTSVGYYSHEEIISLVTHLSEVSKTPVPDLVEAFGKYLFGRLASLHGDLVSFADNAFDLLSRLDDVIHPEVLKLYPDAQLPRFDTLDVSENTIVLLYRSSRHFEVLAQGLVHGCMEHFGESANVVLKPVDQGVEIHITKL